MGYESGRRVMGWGLRFVPLQLLSRVVPRDVVGLCYHVVSDKRLPHIDHLYRFKTVANFESDIEWLQRQYSIVGYDELANARHTRQGSRPNAIITFDDGLIECYTIVREILLRRGVPAVVMVTTGFLDNRTLFYRHKVSLCIDAYLRLPPSRAGQVRRAVADVFPVRQNADIPTCLLGAQWQDADAIDEICLQLGVDVDEYLRTATPYLSSAQVRTLAADGFTIGAHGTNHVPLNLLPQPALEQDILSSCGTVSQLVGSREVPFAFPFNGRGVNQEMLRQLRASYPEVGLFFGTGMLARDQEFIVNRIVVDEPPRPGRSVTNMPEQMRRAYANELARPVKGIIRRLLAK